MCPSDTTPEAWRIFLELQRRMPPEEKLRRTLELSAAMRHNAEAGLRERYPNASDREIFLRLARLTLGAELFERVYGKEGWPGDRAG
jgi:hypothetical protein